jgi:KDPG and KHG aldolase
MALTAIERIAGEVPEIFLGAGTIVEPSQAKQAASAGAQFLVSPGSTRTLLGAMTDTGLPHLPGVATVSEIFRTHTDRSATGQSQYLEQTTRTIWSFWDHWQHPPAGWPYGERALQPVTVSDCPSLVRAVDGI